MAENRRSSATCAQAIRCALAHDLLTLAQQGMSREQAADLLAQASGERITRNMLDKWAARRGVVDMPARLLGIWAKVTGLRTVLEVPLGAAGLQVATLRDMELAMLGRKEVELDELVAERRALKMRIAGGGVAA